MSLMNEGEGRGMKYLRRFLKTFHVCLMPPGCFGRYVWIGPDDYGDLVIWIGRVWIGASWRDEHPWEGELA